MVIDMTERKLDSNYRFFIPREFANKLGWTKGEKLNIELEGKKIIVKQAGEIEIENCCLCETKENIHYRFYKKNICKECKDKLIKIWG